VITIDGPAGVGKSTVAKLLAHQLGLVYLDTGATYRALAFEALAAGIDPHDEARLVRAAQRLQLTLRPLAGDGPLVLLDGRDVTREIRTERVTACAAILAQHPRVRAALVRLQRRLARGGRVVAEGRDTGSVVFPKAPYKFFLTARIGVRARRRQHELQTLHGTSPSAVAIARQLQVRDSLDRRRKIGPLIRPRGTVMVDTTSLRAREVVDRMVRCLPVSPSGRP